MEACPTPQAANPCAIVIFGASGDLTKRKLLPSLYNLGSLIRFTVRNQHAGMLVASDESSPSVSSRLAPRTHDRPSDKARSSVWCVVPWGVLASA